MSLKGSVLAASIGLLSFHSALAATNQFVITPIDGIAKSQLEAQINNMESQTNISFERYMFDQKMFVVSADESYPAKDILEGMSFVGLVEEDIRVYPAFTPNDSRYSEQWAHFEEVGGIKIDLANDLNKGDGASVAVLDTGYTLHTDLDANRLAGVDLVSDPSAANDGDGRDQDPFDEGDFNSGQCLGQPISNSSWHGMHVSGIISAVTNNGNGIAGAAPEAKVVPVRVLGTCGGFLSDIADGVAWSVGATVDDVDNIDKPVDVINMSLGGRGSCSSFMQEAINLANSSRAVVVTAAGNQNSNSEDFTPGNCGQVVNVAATGRDGGKANYSNTGIDVDLAAPGGGNGGSILSTVDSGNTTPSSEDYDYKQGTSMAAPYVAAVVAMMKSVDPSIVHIDVENILKETSRQFPATCNGCGTGIVDANAALLEVFDRLGQEPPPPPISDDSNVFDQNTAYGGEMTVDVKKSETSGGQTLDGVTRIKFNVPEKGLKRKAIVGFEHVDVFGLDLKIIEVESNKQTGLVHAGKIEGVDYFIADLNGDYQGGVVLRVVNPRETSGRVIHFSVIQAE